MRVHAHEKRAGDVLGFPELANGLANGQDMILVEAILERGTPVARGAEGNLLGRVRDVRFAGVIGSDKSWDVYKKRAWSRFPGQFVQSHILTSEPPEREFGQNTW